MGETATMNDVADLAKTIASELLADLKAQKLAKVGIEEIRAAIAARPETRKLDKWQADWLETATLRRFIEGAGV